MHFENYSPVLNRHYEAFAYRPAPEQFAVIFMDITQRKLAEDELCRHRDKLEDLVKERTTELQARNRQLVAEITQRKKAENALRLAGAYNRSLIEASLDPLVTIDVNGRITDVNKATEKVTGRSRRELINTDFSDYFTEPDKARAGYKQVFSEGKVQDYPLDMLHHDGLITPVLYNASLYHDQEGRALGVFAAARDITERKLAEEEKKRLENQLIQAQKIEALGKLAGGIAHDFNNVLQPILINSELISDILPHGTQEREYLDQIIDAAHLGKNLIRQIKLFGSRKGSFCKPITIGPVVQDALNLLKRSIPSRITFKQWINAREGLVRVDQTQIHQLILNLCNNAVQAMKSGKGFLGVSLKETEIASYTAALVSDLKPGKYLKLTVRDTGTGISPDIRDRIFDPFFSTKKSSKGTGLGLAVVHELVKNANGSILLSSDTGKGAKFEVYFPQYTDPQDQAHRQLRQSQGHGEKHILLADDNVGDLRSIHQLLIHLGYQVTSTSDPQEALKIFRDEPKMFSLVITDQVMPRMKGHELAGHIRQIRQDIPVILCSGSEEIMQELQEKNTGINEFILKPFSRSQTARSHRPFTGLRVLYISMESLYYSQVPIDNQEKILIIDDDSLVCNSIANVAKTLGYTTTTALTLKDGLGAAHSDAYDVVFLDVHMPDGNGIEKLPQISQNIGRPEVIVITGYGDPDSVEAALSKGAWDYLEKPFSKNELSTLLKDVVIYHRSNKQPVKAVDFEKEGIFAKSPRMKECLALLSKTFKSEANVLLTGETGTGKELFARAIHNNSARSGNEFVIVDCAALPSNLVESILFGHEKGSYTGADRSQHGLVTQAHQGTLFLDEVGELPLATQKNFLRILQEGRFRPVGKSSEVDSDFRVISATNRNLDKMVETDGFRKDLLFRLQSITIHIPRSGSVLRIFSV